MKCVYWAIGASCACMVFVLGAAFHCWHAWYWVMPGLRHDMWCDAITVRQHLPARLKGCAHTEQASGGCDTIDVERPTCYADIAAVGTYTRAVTIARRLWQQYRVACTIVRHDRLGPEGMRPWYTLRTPFLEEQDCDELLNMVQTHNKIRYYTKKKV